MFPIFITFPVQGELAKWLVEHSCADRVFFCNSGAEANEGAIKLARKYAHTVLKIAESDNFDRKRQFPWTDISDDHSDRTAQISTEF